MSEQNPKSPYKSLGMQLLKLRQRLQESAAEVSGAVEIDLEMLERIENGMELPSEDILLLLINHFNVRDDEAVKLWELAGYDQHEHNGAHADEQHLSKHPVVMLLGMDARVVYTNGVDVSADPSGVVLNFTQYTDPSQAATPIARVGMSHEQAQKVLESLQQALLRSKYAAGPKALPAPRTQKKRASKPKKQSE
jgi:transcriptional regulator with XRE-family HTH domain